jgi:hypothetical protein
MREAKGYGQLPRAVPEANAVPAPSRVQRPTMKFVETKIAEQLDLQALHRVRERLVSQRTSIINQIRALMLETVIARSWPAPGAGWISASIAYLAISKH